MLRLSSNFTLLLRIALPCVYASFFGLLVIAVFFGGADMPLLSNPVFQFGLLAVYLLFLCLIYFTLLRLRRVEYMADQLYVSSYLKNIRYSLDDISSLAEYDLGFTLLVKVKLRAKGVWGKSFYFLAKRVNYRSFLETNPQLASK